MRIRERFVKKNQSFLRLHTNTHAYKTEERCQHTMEHANPTNASADANTSADPNTSADANTRANANSSADANNSTTAITSTTATKAIAATATIKTNTATDVEDGNSPDIPEWKLAELAVTALDRLKDGNHPVGMFTRANMEEQRINARKKSERRQEKRKIQELEEDSSTPPRIKNTPTTLTSGEVEEGVKLFLEDLVEWPGCFSFETKKFVSCNCRVKIVNRLTHAVEFLVFFCKKSKDERYTLLKEWMRIGFANQEMNFNARRQKKLKPHDHPFKLPFGPQGEMLGFCKRTFCNMLSIKRRKWNTLRDSVISKLPGPIPSKMLGNKNQSKSSNSVACHDDVIKFLKEFGDARGEPYATMFVRETTGIGIRNEDADVVQLPSSYTHRQIYEIFCYERGWVVNKEGDSGNYSHLSQFSRRVPDGVTWCDDDEPSVICSYTSFMRKWRRHCSKIVIRPKSEDICGECYILKNKFRYGTRKNRGTETEDEGSDLGKDDDDDDEQDDGNEFEFSFEERETLINQAAQHVKEAKAMREMIKNAEEEAKSDVESGVAHANRRYCLVGDYIQNIAVPNLGANQPGEVYYFSPLYVYGFGVADMSTTPTKLRCFLYKEGEAKKGGDNVASLIMKYLRDAGVLRDGETAKSLTFAFDNCAGQNKNNMVLRLALYLVEKQFFSEVRFLFYVHGHTKNACDRMFNLMKLSYHRKDIFTMSELLKTLNEQRDVQVDEVGEGDFKEWGRFLDQFYKQFKSGTILKNHVFFVEGSKPTTMNTKVFRDSSVVESQEMRYGMHHGESRRQAMREEDVAVIPAPGLKDIKKS